MFNSPAFIDETQSKENMIAAALQLANWYSMRRGSMEEKERR